MSITDNNYRTIVALVSEYPPPFAGMTVLADEMTNRFKKEGYPIRRIRTNPDLFKCFHFINKIRGMRGAIKWLIFLIDSLKIRNVDVVHIFSSSRLNYILFTVPVLFLCSVFNKPVIINYHGGDAYNYFIKHKRLLAWSMKRCHRLVVPSAFLHKVFETLGYESIVIPNFANIERFSYKKNNDYAPIILSTRNFTDVYNIACAINAFKYVVNKYPLAKLNLAGDGPELDNLKKLASDLSLKENIVFLGNIPNDKMPAIYSKSCIFINTSNIDNMPGSIIEAFASGLPVVSTNVGGIPYMVEHGLTGLLAEPDDSKRLGEHLLFLIENPDVSRNLTQNGKEYIKKLTWINIRQKWIHEYCSVLEGD